MTEREVPKNGGDSQDALAVQHLARLSPAGVAGLRLTVLRAAVAVRVVAVVTALSAEHKAVAARRSATAAHGTSGFDLTINTAAIKRERVGIVAELRAFEVSVPAGRLGAGTGTAFALVPDLNLARRRTPVAWSERSVIALLGEGRYSVAALGKGFAKLTWDTTDVPGFHHQTICGAPVTRLQAAVVTGFILREITVAASGRRWLKIPVTVAELDPVRVICVRAAIGVSV